ncbi:hypothetical protein OG735_02035 [Streptomyces sp. NBC_01210]|uniref:hypothetical protein n=1 Tax=Streptomyces sp. NBC_01210 TaxID=2903774 RepID=UPI002E139189|nr:hypothetical protein OG735_02035 [Streptomyces sp. NBC_01210]
MTLTDLSEGFRDDAQRRRVQAVIHDRLADDREQQECRYLMRLLWQLSMPYQEVSIEQLRMNVRKSKLEVVEELISAIRTSPNEVDAWIVITQQACPVIHDSGFAANSD